MKEFTLVVRSGLKPDCDSQTFLHIHDKVHEIVGKESDLFQAKDSYWEWYYPSKDEAKRIAKKLRTKGYDVSVHPKRGG